MRLDLVLRALDLSTRKPPPPLPPPLSLHFIHSRSFLVILLLAFLLLRRTLRNPPPQERFFELLDMFKVVELEKGKPATFKSGGDERPVVLREKDFSLALVNVRAWGVVIEGKQTEIFAQVTQGQKTIGFDAFAHWALKMSVGCEPPESIGGSPPK